MGRKKNILFCLVYYFVFLVTMCLGQSSLWSLCVKTKVLHNARKAPEKPKGKNRFQFSTKSNLLRGVATVTILCKRAVVKFCVWLYTMQFELEKVVQ